MGTTTTNRVVCVAPVRIDLSHGGGSDLPDICKSVGGRAVNIAARIRGAAIRTEVVRTAAPLIRLTSTDTHAAAELMSDDPLVDATAPEGLSLHRAAIASAGLNGPQATVGEIVERLGGGLLVRTETRLPVGSGLGVSGILAATLVWCVRRIAGLSVERNEIVQRSLDAERRLGTRGGWQDVVGGIYGGAKIVVADASDPFCPQVIPIRLGTAVQRVIESRLVLCYTGESHFSGDVIEHLIRDFHSRREPQWRTRGQLVALDEPIALSLRDGNLDRLGHLLEQFWNGFRVLVPEAETRAMRRIVSGVRGELAGYKACGAGGGGCLLLVGKDGSSGRIKSALREIFCEADMVNGRILEWEIDHQGLTGQVFDS